MCGILGAFCGTGARPIGGRFDAALRMLRHRGPDDEGRWTHQTDRGVLTLGHRRLSIIDLSAAAKQPMRSADGRWALVFNGEIYNYRELRGELATRGYQFVSQSDSEVLLAAWATWGTACLRRLVGMFAFAVYDRDENSLTCVRDAFGIKPLYYLHEGDRFLFASELPSLIELGNGDRSLNRQRAYEYLAFGTHDRDFDTFINGFARLPPAHLLRLRLNQPSKPQIERWWSADISRMARLSFPEAAEALRELFLESVRLHLRSDVPLGVALSGGIDSSAIVCAMRHLEPDMPIHTFSFVPADTRISEEPWIDIVNSHARAQVHKIRVLPAELADDLRDLIATQGEPFGSTNMYAQYRVFQEARARGISVVLEGQGGDELLGGYDGYAGQRMASLLESGDFGGMVRFAANWARWPGRDGKSPWRALIGQLLPDRWYGPGLRVTGLARPPAWLDLAALHREGVLLRPQRQSRSPGARRRRVVEVLSYALSVDGLPTLLRYGDRNAMRFSVENRVPFLTLPLAEFVLALPERFLVSDSGETKSVFRAAMRGIVPDAILDRRDKVGFETPMSEWLRASARALRDDLAREPRRFSFLDPGSMVSAFDRALASEDASDWQVWRMLNLVLWSRQNEVN